MRVQLDPFDTHFTYVDQIHATTLNISIRTQLSRESSERNLVDALSALLSRHPYLSYQVSETPTETGVPNFYLEPKTDARISYDIARAPDSALPEVMNQLASKRTYRFNVEEGELMHVQLWSSGSQSILELSCAHLLTDVTGVVMLQSDLLRFLDQAISGNRSDPAAMNRLPFDEARYGWDAPRDPILPLRLPDGAVPNFAPWPVPEYTYRRCKLPENKLREVSSWLRSNRITARPTDVYYFVLVSGWPELLEDQPRCSSVQSFRPLLTTERDRKNINISAVFAVIDVPAEYVSSPRLWLEDFCRKRKAAVTPPGILSVMNFLRSMNLAMHDIDADHARALTNAYIPLDAFAFNNFGALDRYFRQFDNFAVTDVDIQDAVPAQEVRIYSYGESFYMNPMLDPDRSAPIDTFWEEFSRQLDRLILQ